MWDLSLTTIHPLFFEGIEQSQQERERIFFGLLNRAEINKDQWKCLQVGVFSGTESKYGINWVSLDKFDKRPCIDYKCDLAHTPFPDGTFDVIVCNAVLEHVPSPFECAQEMTRIAKDGCELYVEVPFTQPFHPVKGWTPEMGYLLDGIDDGKFKNDENHGGDYWRFTPQSLALLFPSFRKNRDIRLLGDGGLLYYGVKE